MQLHCTVLGDTVLLRNCRRETRHGGKFVVRWTGPWTGPWTIAHLGETATKRCEMQGKHQ